ncbi:hypothetical protein [Bacillus cereus]|uniref:hypothetical protein n=1 Tax=Bacillus cereus TaxID=1396 RepID=UPI000BF32169|nr:hypothetical protein [Bacillus cereus]PFO83584.1 hypothetical protein COJ77_08315 [Bacillus cereus]
MQNGLISILNTKYRFIAKAVWSNKDQRKYMVIAIKNIISNLSILHPISDFIVSNWKHCSFNTQKSHTYNIVKFLNFIYCKQNYYRLKTFSNLSLQHGTDFLNYLTYEENRPKQTVLRFEKTLIQFYKFLSKKKLLNFELNLEVARNHRTNQTYYRSPFKGVHLRNQKKENRLHNLPGQYVLLFLEIAYKYRPNIALGIYMQIFGGLRVGEVVNLRIIDLQTIGPFGQDGIVVDLDTRELRKDLASVSGNDYVKKPRFQLIYGYKDWLKLFYKQHMELTNNKIGHSPLFQTHKGLALTGGSYRYHFKIVKESFLQHLRNSSNPVDRINSISLENTPWSTHIGRGIFSNMLAETAKNLYEVSFPRGDSSLDSVLTYFSNTSRIKQKLEMRLDELFESTKQRYDMEEIYEK